MTRLFLALLVITSLSGCHTLRPSAPLDPPTKTSRLQELLVAKGGPRIIAMNLGGGRVDALPDGDKRSNAIPGFVSVDGIRIMEGDKKFVGIALSLIDSKSPEEKESPQSPTYTMDAEEALEFKKAMQQEIDFALSCMKTPPKHQEDMIWRSAEGLSIAVSSDTSNSAFFTLSFPPTDGGAGFYGLSLSLEAGRKLMAKVDDALNVASGND